jgi:endonuclease I
VKKYLTILVFFLFSSAFCGVDADCLSKWDDFLSKNTLPEKYEVLINLCDVDFKNKLKKLIHMNEYIKYTKAKKYMYDNLREDGISICGVYTDLCITKKGVPNSSVMNCEHSWPQSLGAAGTAKGDLHHLFPSDSYANTKRDRYPFCEVTSGVTWDSEAGSALGRNKFGSKCFEVPDAHKGKLARAMLYFSTRYKLPIGKHQEYYFKKWNKEFPVTEWETRRNNLIFDFQHNYNPYTHFPGFADFVSDF